MNDKRYNKKCMMNMKENRECSEREQTGNAETSSFKGIGQAGCLSGLSVNRM
jgi:hypothetical protein